MVLVEREAILSVSVPNIAGLVKSIFELTNEGTFALAEAIIENRKIIPPPKGIEVGLSPKK